MDMIKIALIVLSAIATILIFSFFENDSLWALQLILISLAFVLFFPKAEPGLFALSTAGFALAIFPLLYWTRG